MTSNSKLSHGAAALITKSALLSKKAIGTIVSMKSPILSCSMVLTLSLGVLSAVYADSATWRMNPMSGDWNTAANWTPDTVPNGPDNIATFGLSNQTAITVSTFGTEVNELIF